VSSVVCRIRIPPTPPPPEAFWEDSPSQRLLPQPLPLDRVLDISQHGLTSIQTIVARDVSGFRSVPIRGSQRKKNESRTRSVQAFLYTLMIGKNGYRYPRYIHGNQSPTINDPTEKLIGHLKSAATEEYRTCWTGKQGRVVPPIGKQSAKAVGDGAKIRFSTHRQPTNTHVAGSTHIFEQSTTTLFTIRAFSLPFLFLSSARKKQCDQRFPRKRHHGSGCSSSSPSSFR